MVEVQQRGRLETPMPDKRDKIPVARERILALKKSITGRFSRKQLHDAVNKDGFGEMKEGTFSPYVSKLIGEGEIIEVEKAVGTKPSIYMWSEEYKKLQDSPSLAAQGHLA
jgi:glycine cleavage system aminomethyltransferase T